MGKRGLIQRGKGVDEAEPSLPSGVRCRTGPLLPLDKLLSRTNLLAASGNQLAQGVFIVYKPRRKMKLKAAEEVNRGTLITPMCYRPIVRGASRQYGVKDVLGSNSFQACEFNDKKLK